MREEELKKRLFVGTFVSLPEFKEVKAFVSSLKVEGKWVEEENLHFTYRFLGDVEEEKIPQIVGFLKQKLKGAPQPKVLYKGLGVFPGKERPRVLWVGIESEGVEEIKRRVDTALVPFGFPVEESFTPHVTLLRIKKMRHRGKFNSYLFKMRNFIFAEKVEPKVALIESKLTERGPIYSVVEEFCLD